MTKETSWGLIGEAAAGNGEARDRFSGLYLPVVHTYLEARWRSSVLAQELDDAVQEVFVECFRENGVLGKAQDHREKLAEDGSSFRAFLLGAVRNVALRVEKRHAKRRQRLDPGSFHPSQIANQEQGLSQVFDQAWARSIMKQAVQLMGTRADTVGGGAPQRVELLRLRFHKGMPIRDIARQWNQDPDPLHYELEKARAEFCDALREVVGLHHKCSREKLEEECSRLLDSLQSGS